MKATLKETKQHTHGAKSYGVLNLTKKINVS
jgi:hypothetical protein